MDSEKEMENKNNQTYDGNKGSKRIVSDNFFTNINPNGKERIRYFLTNYFEQYFIHYFKFHNKFSL